MEPINKKDLYRWCSVPVDQLAKHSPKVPFAVVETREEMGYAMASELVEEVKKNNSQGRQTRAIIPCGPMGWYTPFARIVNSERVSLKNLVVLHMDECLDWQGGLLPKAHPFNFRTTMERVFYNPVDKELGVPEENRFWLTPKTMERVKEEVWKAPVDITLGGWGQDGHIAYNQARRDPYSLLTIEELENSSVRIQYNNWDTVLALAQRSLGAAFQFVPPMSITLGVKECLSARKVRVYSDTGAWKQTAFRVALFGPVTTEYPMTLLQKHPDALVTATRETAAHEISLHPEWELF
jgi:glucosamine-6-phosphate deaminase